MSNGQTARFVGVDGVTYEMPANWLTNLKDVVKLALGGERTLCKEDTDFEANKGFFGALINLHAQVGALSKFYDGTKTELDALEWLEESLLAEIEFPRHHLSGRWHERKLKHILLDKLCELGKIYAGIEGEGVSYQTEGENNHNPAKPWESFSYRVPVQTEETLAYVEGKVHEITLKLFEIERLLSVLSWHEFVPNYHSIGELEYGTLTPLTKEGVAKSRLKFGMQVSKKIRSALYNTEDPADLEGTIDSIFLSRIGGVARGYRQQAMAQDGLYCFWKKLAAGGES